ncbi:MAG TPA: redoxin domain-containing protein [Planctomycetaceae bacterium]|nr:redoxin domain-containing protein [Planctomycetaceae bacterium]HIQ22223.1 redoxin domain-containing protein [Planctomycetota bacterium]
MVWLNTGGPIELRELRGKFVLLDFWTYCCINCMHVLPELEKLEDAYPNSLVVIGVHSAKFLTEQDSRNITEAILRYGIRHPVINDHDHRVWNLFGVRAWPTLLLIDPEGYMVWGASGETTFGVIDRILRKAMPYYRARGLVDESPLRFELAANTAPRTSLRYPGKILADPRHGRLFVADSGHHRIVEATLDGELVTTIGSGRPGAVDGDFATARFKDPQGMALHGDVLLVADTGNHLIRRVDLAGGQVTTIAGTGSQDRRRPVAVRGHPRQQPLNSPWALWLHGDELFIAMAGAHQIWKMRLDGSAISPFAGNGREDIVDGPLLPPTPFRLGYASFAQPSGLASDGRWLYVADSEGSSIRAVPLAGQGTVRTVVGTAQLPAARLFTFGDADGPREQVRLQHPLGIVYYRERLYVADTYNNKIKVIDPNTGWTQTLVGTGEAGRTDDPARLDEPAGITAAAGKLLVADTNNHLVRVVDLENENKLSTLEIRGLEPPPLPTNEGSGDWLAGATEHPIEPVAVGASDGQVRFRVSLHLPAGFKLNPRAPMAYMVQISGTGPLSPAGVGQPTRVQPPATQFQFAWPVAEQQGKQTVLVGVNFYYCREGSEGVCKVGSVAWRVPLEVHPDGPNRPVELDHRVEDRRVP